MCVVNFIPTVNGASLGNYLVSKSWFQPKVIVSEQKCKKWADKNCSGSSIVWEVLKGKELLFKTYDNKIATHLTLQVILRQRSGGLPDDLLLPGSKPWPLM